eukprot:GHVO01009727.1.p1 GENE.GHVO01009727.1~~GHVO01009727.1.p1  ORF type:complete len:199 (+),score=46.27 GHVO01009727.1:263-859(+)
MNISPPPSILASVALAAVSILSQITNRSTEDTYEAPVGLDHSLVPHHGFDAQQKLCTSPTDPVAVKNGRELELISFFVWRGYGGNNKSLDLRADELQPFFDEALPNRAKYRVLKRQDGHHLEMVLGPEQATVFWFTVDYKQCAYLNHGHLCIGAAIAGIGAAFVVPAACLCCLCACGMRACGCAPCKRKNTPPHNPYI